jgi:hypothetical protein
MRGGAENLSPWKPGQNGNVGGFRRVEGQWFVKGYYLSLASNAQ